MGGQGERKNQHERGGGAELGGESWGGIDSLLGAPRQTEWTSPSPTKVGGQRKGIADPDRTIDLTLLMPRDGKKFV